jgi:hypothetical protein
VFEKYWDYLACLGQHPDFANESEYTREGMTLVSQGLSRMASQGTFELRPSSEAKDGDVLVAEHAATSRLRARLSSDRVLTWSGRALREDYEAPHGG